MRQIRGPVRQNFQSGTSKRPEIAFPGTPRPDGRFLVRLSGFSYLGNRYALENFEHILVRCAPTATAAVEHKAALTALHCDGERSGDPSS